MPFPSCRKQPARHYDLCRRSIGHVAWIASAPLAQQATPSPGADAYCQRFLAGQHVALSDSRLDIDKLELRLEDDFGRKKPVLRARFANRSGMTLSSATFRLQLFIQGETRPVVDSKAGFSSEHVYVFFDSKGLADGASVKEDLTSLRSSNWNAPDLLNAIRAGQAHAVLRLESLGDGRKQALPSKATAIDAL